MPVNVVKTPNDESRVGVGKGKEVGRWKKKNLFIESPNN
jgi:hypothetical protein